MSHHDTRLAYANLHQIDQAGHYGKNTAYVDRISDIDAPLAAFWEWVRDTPPYAGHTTLVLLADHGRHDTEEEESWRNHGDDCSGCRNIPLLFAGPGIAAGTTVHATVDLSDVAQTVATILGVSLPMGTGGPIAEITGTVAEDPRDAAVAAAGAHRMIEGDGIRLDDEPVSDPEALHAEGPVLVAGKQGLLACWRELGLDLVWTGHCSLDGEDLGLSTTAVSPRWTPSVLADDTGFWLAWADNRYEYTGAADVRPKLVRWDGTWRSYDAGPETSLPTQVSIAPGTDGHLRVAFAASGEETRGRDTRQVEVWEVATDRGTWVRRELYEPDETWARLEAPVATRDRVAMLAYGDGTTVLVGHDGDRTRLDPTGRVLGGAGVHADGDAFLWARLSKGGTVEVCRWQDVLAVTDTGAATITSLAPTDTGWVAVLDGEVVEGGW